MLKTSPVRPSEFDPDAAAPAESGIYGLPFTAEDSKVIIIPVPYEATTSYGGGTSNGPAAVLEASKQVDLFDQETGRPYASGIAMLDIPKNVLRWNSAAKRMAARVIEKGGVVDRPTQAAADKVNEYSERVNSWVYDQTVPLLRQGKLAVTLGGDHSVPYGAIRAYAQKYPGLGILHLDAHADLRDSYEGFTWSHASIFNNVMRKIPGVGMLVQVGVRDLGMAERKMIDTNERITTFYDAEIASRKEEGVPFATIADEIIATLPQDIYLS